MVATGEIFQGRKSGGEGSGFQAGKGPWTCLVADRIQSQEQEVPSPSSSSFPLPSPLLTPPQTLSSPETFRVVILLHAWSP